MLTSMRHNFTSPGSSGSALLSSACIGVGSACHIASSWRRDFSGNSSSNSSALGMRGESLRQRMKRIERILVGRKKHKDYRPINSKCEMMSLTSNHWPDQSPYVSSDPSVDDSSPL